VLSDKLHCLRRRSTRFRALRSGPLLAACGGRAVYFVGRRAAGAPWGRREGSNGIARRCLPERRSASVAQLANTQKLLAPCWPCRVSMRKLAEKAAETEKAFLAIGAEAASIAVAGGLSGCSLRVPSRIVRKPETGSVMSSYARGRRENPCYSRRRAVPIYGGSRRRGRPALVAPHSKRGHTARLVGGFHTGNGEQHLDHASPDPSTSRRLRIRQRRVLPA